MLPTGKRIGEAEVGHPLLLLNETGDGHKEYSIQSIRPDLQECVLLKTESGIELTCSYSTPIVVKQEDGMNAITVHECLNKFVPVLDFGEFRWEKIVEVNPVGILPVRLLSADNGVYAAGNASGRYIFTHNQNLTLGGTNKV